MKRGLIHRALHVLPTAIVGALTVFFFIGFRYREPPWIQDRILLLLGLELAHAYVIGLILVRSNLLRAEQFFLRAVHIIAIGSLVFLPVAMQLLLAGFVFSRLTLLVPVGLVFFLLLVNGLAIPKKAAWAINIAVLAIGVQPSLSASSRASFIELIMGKSVKYDMEYRFSSLHDIKLIDNKVTPSLIGTPFRAQGGALEAIDSLRLLLVDANGAFYLLSLEDGGVVSTSPLDQLRTPMNKAAYFRDVKYPPENFRVTDMLLEDAGIEDKRTLYVAYHHWDEQEKCITLNVDETQVDLESLNRPLTWQNRFKTTPCISGRRLTNETGGRLALRSPNSLLVTVGVTVSGGEFWEGVSADDVSSYGKIIEIDRTNWTSRIFTKGHRNPQGLMVEGDRIWSTEHGPDGGDELNIIVDGKDYGWPTSSYGTDYGKKTLKGSDTPGDHSTGQRPVYAWVPSIGISRLIRVKGKAFPAWRDDLLVASLSGRGNGFSLYRVRIREDQVQVVERIRTGKRVRDLVEMPNGQFVTWDGETIVQTITAASHVFSECTGCHALNKGFAANGIGPDLWGIVGSPVASVEGFQYSQSMKNFGGRWSRERLDIFLRDPQKVVPGTKMTVVGIEDKDKRHTIIKFLANVSR